MITLVSSKKSYLTTVYKKNKINLKLFINFFTKFKYNLIISKKSIKCIFCGYYIKKKN